MVEWWGRGGVGGVRKEEGGGGGVESGTGAIVGVSCATDGYSIIVLTGYPLSVVLCLIVAFSKG